MMPCPWVLEVAEQLKEEEYDYGIHSTLNSEWIYYKWRPVADNVPSLVDDYGYLLRDPLETVKKGLAEHVKREIEEQVKKSFKMGLKPSHLDTHMGTVYMRRDFLHAYLDIAEKYNLIPLTMKLNEQAYNELRKRGLELDKETRERLINLPFPKLDKLITEIPGKTLHGRIKFFEEILKSLKENTLTMIIVHLGLETEELKAIIGTGYYRRVLDFKLVTSTEAKKLLEEYNIELVEWKDVK